MKRFRVLSTAQRGKLLGDLENASLLLYQGVAALRSQKYIGMQMAKCLRIQRQLVASDMLAKGKKPQFKP